MNTLLLGQALNLFDFLVIDLLWWRHTKRVRFSGTEGWMQNECLKGSRLSAYPTGICKGSDVNVRKSPNLTGKVLTQLQKGERFTVISILPSQWLHIRKDKQEGYVYYDPSYLTIHLAK